MLPTTFILWSAALIVVAFLLGLRIGHRLGLQLAIRLNKEALRLPTV